MSIKYPYLEKESNIFGKIKRPLISIEIASPEGWIIIDEVLADTGADITLLPRLIGEMIVDDITKGIYVEIRGVVPSAILVAFIHNLRLKVAEREFETKVAIADSNDIPPILGRFNALDLFSVRYKKGKEAIFEK